jgi:hypothetical protein
MAAAEPVEVETVTQEAREVVAIAATVSVTNAMEFEAAGAFLTNKIKPAQKWVQQLFEKPKKATHGAWKSVVAQEQSLLEPLADAETKIKRGMSAYAAEQERQRRAAEAEAARRQREEQARMEAERAAQAEALAESGETEAAVELLDAPAPLAFVMPAPVEAPKAAGIATRRGWTFRIVDPARVNRAFLVVDEKKIAALVRAIGPDAAAQVGGIVVEESFSVAARAN